MLPELASPVSRRRFVGVSASLLGCSRLWAWQNAQNDPARPPQDNTAPENSGARFSTAVNVVNVFVSVHDKDGQISRGLTVNDFTLDEDGRPQVIRYFATQSDLPLTLGLLVDTSGSQRRVLDQKRTASYDFFEHVLREDRDKAFVIHFDREVELLQDLTSSRRDLEASLKNLDGRPQLNRRGQDSDPSGGNPYPSGGNSGGYPRGGGGPNGGGGGRGRGGGTALYDAVLLASDELMRKQQGRKAVVLLSDGVDNGSKVSLGSAIESAQRADTSVYSVRFADDSASNNGFGGGPFGGGMGRGGGMGGGGMGRGRGRMPPENRVDGKKILQQISRETGGEYFEISGNKMTLSKIYDRIELDLRNQYNLGYTSDQTGGGYRKIHVAVKPKNLVVQARDGYYPHTDSR